MRSIPCNPSKQRHWSIAVSPVPRANARSPRTRTGDCRSGRVPGSRRGEGVGIVVTVPTTVDCGASALRALGYGDPVGCPDSHGTAIETSRTLHSEHGAIVTVYRVLLLQSYNSFSLPNTDIVVFSRTFFSPIHDRGQYIHAKLSMNKIRMSETPVHVSRPIGAPSRLIPCRMLVTSVARSTVQVLESDGVDVRSRRREYVPSRLGAKIQ